MEEELRALLLADAGITAITASRVSWGRHPQGAALPALVLNVVSDTGDHHMQGPTLLENARVQIDSYANDYGTAKNLSRAVRSAIDGHKGGGFQGIFLMVSRDMDDAASGTDEATRPFRVSADYETFWSEPNG